MTLSRPFHTPFVALFAAVCLTVLPAAARDLSGRVFLGARTQLHIQEDESVITNILRAVKLVKSEVPVLNLNSIAIQNDYLFIGEDHELYFIDKVKKDKIFHVGSAQDLSNIKLFDGVVLKAVENPSSNFESGQREIALKVVMKKEMETAEPDVKRARYQHYLEELVNIYDETTMTEGAKRNYTILMNALSTALPDGDNEDPRAFEHLKILKRYIEAAGYSSAVPLVQLVNSVLKRVKANQEKEDLAQAASDVRPAYDKLAGLLAKASN
ncbi:MAG: hypothetical protein HY303_03295 [Candidatus Wallbacteria bacterium]|nr:hypothetical protein [Candidatus Wallbacteria bacterium]